MLTLFALIAPKKVIPKEQSEATPLDSGVMLIVEDNKVNQMVLKGHLKKMGYQSDLAENGLIAIEKIQRQQYTMIFMDCQMPVMDGFEATEKSERIPLLRQNCLLLQLLQTQWKETESVAWMQAWMII